MIFPQPWVIVNNMGKFVRFYSFTVLRPNKKISVFWVSGLKFLGRVGTHIFFLKKFWKI